MPKRQVKMVLRVLERTEERSTLFWWMIEHHDEMMAAAGGGRPRWRQLCERFAVLGLQDGHGKLPSPEAARRTWRHVREVVAKAATRPPSPPASKYPSRISPDWRPPVVAAPQQPTAPAAPNKPYDPDEQIARIRRIVAERSGRKV